MQRNVLLFWTQKYAAGRIQMRKRGGWSSHPHRDCKSIQGLILGMDPKRQNWTWGQRRMPAPFFYILVSRVHPLAHRVSFRYCRQVHRLEFSVMLAACAALEESRVALSRPFIVVVSLNLSSLWVLEGVLAWYASGTDWDFYLTGIFTSKVIFTGVLGALLSVCIIYYSSACDWAH